jgi:CelD/BcsL family acetyltransferase involved in cellulose biosynthesis
VNILCHTSFSDLQSSAAEWNALVMQCPSATIFQTFEWLQAWAETYRTFNRLCILIASDDNRIIGIAPLMERHIRFAKFLTLKKVEWIAPEFSDYCDFIIQPGREQSVISAFLDYLKTTVPNEVQPVQYDWIELNDIPDNSPTHKILSCLNGETFCVEKQLGSTYLFINTQREWETYLQQFGSKARKNRQRERNTLGNDFTLEFTQANRPEDVAESLQTLIAYNVKRMAATNRNSFFLEEQNRKFVERVVDAFRQQGWLDMHVVKLNNITRSVMLNFQFKGRTYFYLSGFDDDYRAYSLGSVHLLERIKKAFDEKSSAFDFLRGTDEYKLSWHVEQAHSTHYEIYPNRFHFRTRRRFLKSLARMYGLMPKSVQDRLYGG